MSSVAELQNLEWYSGVPRSISKHTLFGFVLVAAAFGGFGSWAALAPLSAAVIAPGSFVATGENKIVQHFEGGIVKDLLVLEGDQVEAGQPLLLLDETAARASAQQLQLRLVRLETIWARLNAEAQGLDDYEPPKACGPFSITPRLLRSTKASAATSWHRVPSSKTRPCCLGRTWLPSSSG